MCTLHKSISFIIKHFFTSNIYKTTKKKTAIENFAKWRWTICCFFLQFTSIKTSHWSLISENAFLPRYLAIPHRRACPRHREDPSAPVANHTHKLHNILYSNFFSKYGSVVFVNCLNFCSGSPIIDIRDVMILSNQIKFSYYFSFYVNKFDVR